ncbi:Eaa prophage protein [Enterobacter asburiae]|nr:Eaa prophage protein [Enterobacter asburiae]
MGIITTERLTKILSETQAVISECNARGVHGSVEVNARLFENVLMELLRQRAAMGKTEPRKAVRSDHAEWSQSTFGDVGPVGPLKHLSKEALEAAAEPEDLSEWADMQFLLWDAQRRAGISDEQITQAMIDKLALNKTRQWPEPKDGEPRLHIKAASPQEVKTCT